MDISQDLNNVWAAMARHLEAGGANIMFVGINEGDGTSRIAANFARLCASRASGAVWLLDLDFFNNGQFGQIANLNATVSGPFDMTFGQKPFWHLTPYSEHEKAIVSGYRIGSSKLFISKFRRELLKPNQMIQIAQQPQYWAAVRRKIEITIIDAPPVSNSRAAFAILADMDAIVLVIDADNGDPDAAIALREEIERKGGKCLGAVLVSSQAA